MPKDKSEYESLQAIGKSAMASIRKMIDALQDAEKSDDESAIDAARDIIREDPLSVEVRSGWYQIGFTESAEPVEYSILLSTGGPATRITGDLDDYNCPISARLEAQDWFQPWTEYHGGDAGDEESLLTYAREFCFSA